MNDFKRAMVMEVVRLLHQPKRESHRPSTAVPRRTDSRNAAPAPEPKLAGYAWATGSRARVALETALQRLTVEVRSGQRGWGVGLRQDGATVTLRASSGAACLLGTADRQLLRLMIVGRNGWTFVMHPLLGVATLDEDPK